MSDSVPPYEAPHVSDLGDVASLTRGAAGATPDLVVTGSQ